MPSRTDLRLTDHEYKTMLVGTDVMELCIAGYQLLGWILIEKSPPPVGNNETMLTFCKAQQIVDNPDLVRLNKRLDSYIGQVNSMEKIRRWAAFRFSVFMCVIGTGTYYTGIRALMFGRIEIMLLLFAFGALQMIFSSFLYRYIKRRKTEEMNRLIAQTRAEIEELMEQIYQKQNNRV